MEASDLAKVYSSASFLIDIFEVVGKGAGPVGGILTAATTIGEIQKANINPFLTDKEKGNAVGNSITKAVVGTVFGAGAIYASGLVYSINPVLGLVTGGVLLVANHFASEEVADEMFSI